MARSKSTITIYEGIPFDVTANNVRMFNTEAEREAFLNEPQHHPLTFSGSYQRVSAEGGGMTRAPYLADNIAFYNYIKVVNTNGEKAITWYGFIEDITYISGDEILGKGVSHIPWSVDAGQTFLQSFADNKPTIKGTVVRGHVKRYESDGFTPNKRIQTVNEPIQAPAPILYDSQEVPFQKVTLPKGNMYDGNITYTYYNSEVQWVVMGVLMKDIKGSYVGTSTPFSIFVLPICGARAVDLHVNAWSTTPAVDITNRGDDGDPMTWYDISELIAKDETFAGTSGNIVFQYIVPYIGMVQTIKSGHDGKEFTVDMSIPGGSGIKGQMFSASADDPDHPTKGYNLLRINWVPSFNNQNVKMDDSVWHFLHDQLDKYYDGESKLLTAPFTQLTLHNGRGDYFDYNPQEFVSSGTDTNPLTIYRRGAMGQSPKQHYYLYGYRQQGDDTRAFSNSTTTGFVDGDDTSLPFEYDQMVQFMANHKNSIAQSRHSAKLSYSQSMTQLGAQQKSLNMSIDAGNAQLGNNIEMQKQANIMTRMQQSQVMQGLTGGGGLGDLSATQTMNRGIANQIGNQNISNELAKNQNQLQYTTSANINAQNRDNALAGIQAGLNDTANNSQNLGQLGGNIAFDFGNDNMSVYLSVKAIPMQAVNTIIQQFKRFGYMYGYYVDDLWTFITTRKAFNFVQYGDIEVYGDIPVSFQKIIKQMLGAGVTFWHTDNMYNITQDNSEV